MRTLLRLPLRAVLWLPVLAVCSATLGAAPQEPATAPPVSLERIREALDKAPPRLKADVPVKPPMATFRTRVEQRVFVPTLEEHLRKEFALTVLQRQSAEWASQCCGPNIGQLIKIVNDAWKARQVRKTREQIARELAELEAARKKTR